MSDLESRPNAAESSAGDEAQSIEYPTHHVLAVLETSDQVDCTLDGLTNSAFLESEIELNRGEEFADQLGSSTGRRGLSDWFIRLFQSVGLKNAETELKEHYEQALRDGHAVIAILTPTDERKDLAVQLLRECGARFINYFGRLNVERIGH